MPRILSLFCLALVATLGTASAAIVTFDTLPGSNADPFTAITENGITVTSTTGAWLQGFAYGDPLPSLFTQSASASLTVTTGGLFSFVSFDLGNGTSINPDYLYQGFVGATQVLSASGSPGAGNTFVTITNSSPATLIDRLVITTTLKSSSDNIDNINLDLGGSSVPEPGTVTLGALGLTGLYLARRRRVA